MTAYEAVVNLLRRFEQETGEIPTRIEVSRKLFMGIWAHVATIATVEHRRGLFTEGDQSTIDAGNPVVELVVGGMPVRIMSHDPVYQRDLCPTPARKDG